MKFQDILMVAATQSFGGTPAPAAPINATDAVGWSGTAPVVNPGDTFSVSGSGYDSTGAVTTIVRTVAVTKQLRQIYPNSGLLQANKVALSDYIRSTDTTAAFPGTTAVTPTPIVAYTDRPVGAQVVGNTVDAECYVDHWDFRSGAPVPCVEFIWSDGVNTVSAKATAPQVLGGAYDLNAVIGYKVTGVNISSLTNGNITLNIKAYPWVGGAASIADSSSGTIGARGFVPRQYVKNPTLAAAPFYVYVDPVGGNDTTGIASTTAASARLLPCLTFHGGMNKLRTAAGNETGGSIMRIMDTGAVPITVAPTTSAATAEVLIEADPLGTPGVPQVNYGNNINVQQKYARWKNLKMSRTLGVFSLTGPAGGHQIFENCVMDLNSVNTALCTVTISFIGGSLLNWAGATFSGTATYGVWLVRGFSAAPLVPSTQLSMDSQWAFGSNFGNVSLNYPATLRTTSGHCFHGLKFVGCQGSTSVLAIGSNNAADTNCVNVSISNISYEWIGTTSSTPGIRLSSDPPQVTNMTHVLVTNVTCTGGLDTGRQNIFYDNNSSTVVRTMAFCKWFANIGSQPNIKEDYFVGTSGADPTDAPLHIANWSCLYGVGWGYNFWQYINASGTSTLPAAFLFEYPGISSTVGTGNTTATRSNPLFTTDGTTTVTAGPVYVLGTGSSNLIPQSGSPCKAVVPAGARLWPWDINGNATNGTIGAYNAA